MTVWETLTSNYIINVGVASFMLAQILKMLFTFLVTKEWNLERLVGAGGMPSSHSALTASIAVAMARKLGWSSPIFGLALAFATIVMYDAMGVRRAAGEQAKVLNKMMFELPNFPFVFGKELKKDKNKDTEKPQEEAEKEADETAGNAEEPIQKMLKEYLGHTPLEVLGGCLLGILIAMFMPPF